MELRQFVWSEGVVVVVVGAKKQVVDPFEAQEQAKPSQPNNVDQNEQWFDESH